MFARCGGGTVQSGWVQRGAVRCTWLRASLHHRPPCAALPGTSLLHSTPQRNVPVGAPVPAVQLPWAKKAASGDPLDTKYPYVCHAEMNALLNKNGASGACPRRSRLGVLGHWGSMCTEPCCDWAGTLMRPRAGRRRHAAATKRLLAAPV